MQKNTLAALEVFRSLGATVEEVDLGWTHEALDAGLAYLNHLFGASLSTLLEEHGDEMTTYVREFAEQGKRSKAVDFVNSLEVANQMYATLRPLLEKCHILICPTNALPAVPADFDHTQGTVTINGKTVNPMLGWVMTTPFNTLSRCPVLTLPTGHASNRVPTSIQVAGRTYCDRDVFWAGMACESENPTVFVSKNNLPSLQS